MDTKGYSRPLGSGLYLPDRLRPILDRIKPIAGAGSAPLWLAWNGAMPTTAAGVKVTTGTSIKTMMQIKLASGCYARVREWGISFDGSAAATPIEVELIETGTVFATVTAYTTGNDISPLNAAAINAVDTEYFTLGTSASGFTSSAEGTITASRYLAAPQLVAPTNQNIIQLPLGAEADMRPSDSYRIRVTAGAAVNVYCYMIIET